MLRAQLAVEAESSAHVFAVYVSKAKDSIPGLFVARTEGFLGPISWAQEHHGDVKALGQFFTAFEGPRGVYTDMGLVRRREDYTSGIVEGARLPRCSSTFGGLRASACPRPIGRIWGSPSLSGVPTETGLCGPSQRAQVSAARPSPRAPGRRAGTCAEADFTGLVEPLTGLI